MQYVAAMSRGESVTPATLSGASRRTGIPSDLLRPLSPTLAKTDSSGAFSFKDLLPGRYVLIARREGYFASANAESAAIINRLVTLDAGARSSHLDIFMTRGGIVSGLVKYPEGQPAAGVDVVTYQLTYPDGRPQFAPSFRATTDVAGKFRVAWVTPGQYFIAAVPKSPNATPDRQDAWARTFYPGVLDPAGAVSVLVNGDEYGGANFDIRTATIPTYNVSGTVINPVGSEVDRSISNFLLVRRNDSPTVSLDLETFKSNAEHAEARPNGEFEIRDVKPGSYELYATYFDASLAAPRVGHVPVDVLDRDVNGLSVPIRPGTTLEAQVEIEGSPPSIKLDTLHLNFRILDVRAFSLLFFRDDLTLDSNGKAAAPNLPESRYSLSLRGLPESAYIADIRQSGQSVYDDGIVLSQQITPVRIIVNMSGATLTGTVQTADRKPVENATVVLVPPPNRRQNASLFKTTNSDNNGHYSLNGIMPGSYTLLAFQDIPSGEPWLNSDFIGKYADRARSITLSAGSHSSMQLELLSN